MTTGPIVTLGTTALKTAITHYYKELKGYEGQEVDYELGLRSAFQNLSTCEIALKNDPADRPRST